MLTGRLLLMASLANGAACSATVHLLIRVSSWFHERWDFDTLFENSRFEDALESKCAEIWQYWRKPVDELQVLNNEIAFKKQYMGL